MDGETDADPFAVFDDEEDVIHTDLEGVKCVSRIINQERFTHEKPDAVRRDKMSGVLSFHPNTEIALCLHVKQGLQSIPDNVEKSGHVRKSKQILKLIDDFCLNRHWMMHVGPKKGSILLDELEKSLYDYKRQRSFVVVELGTYCGYSAILMADFLCSRQDEFHLFSVEINEGNAEIARELIAMSGLKDFVTVIVAQSCEEAMEKINNLQHTYEKIDFLFLDHDKDSYLSDLQKMEEMNYIAKGSKVVADNVLFAQISDYIDYCHKKQDQGKVSTRTIECTVEYSEYEAKEYGLEKVKDGIEITMF